MNIPSVFIQILVQMSLSIFIILGHFRIFNKLDYQTTAIIDKQ